MVAKKSRATTGFRQSFGNEKVKVRIHRLYFCSEVSDRCILAQYHQKSEWKKTVLEQNCVLTFVIKLLGVSADFKNRHTRTFKFTNSWT